ncbi:MAG: hypothetical protein J6V90_08140 [Treponema sp.]|nr:hypothetical protein [Treponema sp.]
MSIVGKPARLYVKHGELMLDLLFKWFGDNKVYCQRYEVPTNNIASQIERAIKSGDYLEVWESIDEDVKEDCSTVLTARQVVERPLKTVDKDLRISGISALKEKGGVYKVYL